MPGRVPPPLYVPSLVEMSGVLPDVNLNTIRRWENQYSDFPSRTKKGWSVRDFIAFYLRHEYKPPRSTAHDETKANKLRTEAALKELALLERQINLAEKQAVLIPVETANQLLDKVATIYRNSLDILRARHGNDAARIIEEAIQEVSEFVEREFNS